MSKNLTYVAVLLIKILILAICSIITAASAQPWVIVFPFIGIITSISIIIGVIRMEAKEEKE